MNELKPRIQQNGINYILVGDYYVPDLKLPEEHRPIGKWGRLHRAYLQQCRPALFSTLVLSGELHTCLADLNELISPLCQELDLSRPLMLKKHLKEIEDFSRVVFHPSDFIEPVDFDRFEVEIFYPKKK